VLYVFLCCTSRQVSPRRAVPLSSRLKGVRGSKVPFAMKARPCVRARAMTLSVGSGVRAPLRSVARSVCPLTSLQRTSARLRLLERRTAARFLHTSPQSATAPLRQRLSEPRHGSLPRRLYRSSKELDRTRSRQVQCSEAMLRTTYLSRGDRQKEFHSKYIRTALGDQSPVRHSARLVSTHRPRRLDMEGSGDTARTFVSRRLSPRKSDGDYQNFPLAVKQETTSWHSAVLQRSDDGNIGRFILRRSPMQSTFAVSEAGRASQSWRSSDIYGPRYSRPEVMQAARSAAVPSSSAASSDDRYVLPTAGRTSGSDEHVLYAALSRSTVGFYWSASVS